MKKQVAWMLIFTLLITYLPNITFANSQKPTNDKTITKITVRSTKTGDKMEPDVVVEWHGVRNTTNTSEDRTEFYEYDVTDLTTNAKMSSISPEAAKGDNSDGNDEDKATYSVNLNKLNNKNFTNGKLYKIEIKPYHIHRTTVNGQVTEKKVPADNNKGVGYFITDLDTRIENIDGELCITFDYIKGASYSGQYIAASRKSIQEVQEGTDIGGAKIEPIPFSMSEAEASKPENRYNGRVKYVIQNAMPGQVYSAYTKVSDVAESVVDNLSFSKIYQNDKVTQTDGPKVAVGVKQIDLTGEELEPNLLELKWKVGSWATIQGVLKQTKVYRTDKDGNIIENINTINNSNLGIDQNTSLCARPTEISYFKVVLELEGIGEAESNIYKYVPNVSVDKPLKPQIPKPLYKGKVFETEQEKETLSNYIVSGYDRREVKTEEEVEKIRKDAFTVNTNPLSIQLAWNAPMTLDNKENKVVDYGLSYDIYVSDQNNFEGLEPNYKNVRIDGKNKDELIINKDAVTVVGFKKSLTEYTTKAGAIKPIEPNKTYYIKMVAKRLYGDENNDEFFYSEPTIVNITTNVEGDISNPQALAKPPLKLQGTTSTTATLRWRTNWYEIYANTPELREKYNAIGQDVFGKQWNSEVFKGTSDPIIRFKSESDDAKSEKVILEKIDDVNNVLGWVAPEIASQYAKRRVSLGADTKYETKVIKYEDALKMISAYNDQHGTQYPLEEWLLMTKGEETEGHEWKKNIEAHVPTENPEKDNNEWLEYVEEGLEANTRYLIIIRAYRNEDEEVKTYPSYVIATTAPEATDVNPSPTTPLLNLKKDSITDTSLSVYWKYDKKFDYEIRYSRLEDPESATSWPFEIIENPEDEKYNLDADGNAVITITGLQPETTYNIWIKAKQKEGTLESKWSNPVTATTKTLETPAPPRGLGKADAQSILAAGKDFKPVGEDYITVEWIKDPADQEDDKDNNQQSNKVYSYILEMADNVSFFDAISVDTTKGAQGTSVEILSKSLVRFKDLRAHYPYYFRVKTVVTYTNPETGKEIIKESEFCSLVRVFTATSNGEYDGGENPNIVIYPDPVEESYKNSIWTYHIVDAAKVTTQILQKKDYYYTVTLNNYKGKYDAVTRSLKMPTKVLQTIYNQGMALQIVTNLGTYQIPGDSLKSYMNLYQGTDTVQFDLTRKAYSDIMNYAKPYPEQYQSGEVLEINFRGKNGSTKVNTLDKEMTVKLRTDVSGAYNYNNYTTAQYNFAEGNWKDHNYQVDTQDNKLLNYNTIFTGLNALYLKAINNSSNNSSYLMNALASSYNITGLGTNFAANGSVKSAQYVKLMVGIAENSPAIDLTSAVTEEEYQKAKAAGFYISNTRGNVTKEQALAGAVKLYEIKHGSKIKASNMSFNGVSGTYAQAVSKAYAVGMIERLDNPRSNVKYNELCDWIALAIE